VIFTKCLVNFFFVCGQILLINFKKEILAFVPKEGVKSNLEDDSSNECSSVLVVGESMAIVAHNEDANVNLFGHT
jgi:hypothetical protein